jgi:hypothetical protein
LNLAQQSELVDRVDIDTWPASVRPDDAEEVGAEGAARDRMRDRKVADEAWRGRPSHGRIPAQPRSDTAADRRIEHTRRQGAAQRIVKLGIT